jgi:cytochrome c peroxidase
MLQLSLYLTFYSEEAILSYYEKDLHTYGGCWGICANLGHHRFKQPYCYAAQTLPNYIVKDNTPPANPITDKGATLGRVLFYDKQLSVNNTIACASCHQQRFAFSDTATQSIGFNGGLTGRHSMRLVNSRFSIESKFFWDERATSLENQTTQPIQNHVEMGFSNTNGDPGLDSLIRKMESISYYPQLFNFVYGSPEITEDKIQKAIAQFVRSIQSYDSKYDIGRAQVNADNVNFPNFTAQENQGKALFLAPPPNGAGCQGCHAAPEFDIAPNSLNNGIIQDATDTTVLDLTNTRAPSLRDVVNPNGIPNGPYMHNGKLKSLLQVVNHYNSIPAIPANTNLDPKLRGPNNQGQNLNLSDAQKDALVAFMKTLSGNDVYTNTRWSSPFDANGNIDIVEVTQTGLASATQQNSLVVYPNPVVNDLYLTLPQGWYKVSMYTLQGQLVQEVSGTNLNHLNVSSIENGIYILRIEDRSSKQVFTQKIVKGAL